MAFDTKGRLWVAAWKNYPHWQPKTPMDDKLIILEDTNGDGKADKSTVFAGDLNCPTGFEFWNGGVLLAQQPNLVFLKDTNGDDKADTKEIILHGFDSADTHHAINSFTFDRGGALYMQEGIFHRTSVESPWGPVTRQNDGGVYRFEPRTWKFETYVPFNFPNPHGHVFDQWSRDIVFDATGGQPYYGPSFSTKKYFPAMEHQAGAEARRRAHAPRRRRRAPLEPPLPRSDAGQPHRAQHHRFPGPAELQDQRGRRRTEDHRSRTDAQLGRSRISDQSMPKSARMAHSTSPTGTTRSSATCSTTCATPRAITCTAACTASPPWAGPCSSRPRSPARRSRKLLDLLKEPENRVRYRAKIELSARDTKDVLAAVQAWTAKLDPKDPAYEHHMMEALWVHQWHNRVDEKLLTRMLKSSDPWARAAATRVLCYWRDRVANPLALLKTLATDEHPGVRLEAIRAASFFQTSEAAEVALASLAQPQDRFLKYTLDQTMNTLKPFVR